MLLRMYLRWIRAPRLQARDDRLSSPATRPGSRARRCSITGEYAYGCCRPRPACIGWCASRRSTQAARRHTSFASVYVWPELPEDVDDRDRREGPAHRHVPLERRRRPARQRHRLGGPHHAPARPASSSPARTSGRSIRNREVGDEGAEVAALRPEDEGAAGEAGRRSAARRRRSPSAARSAATCCTRIRWSRTTGRRSRSATSTACSTATSTTSSSRPWWRRPGAPSGRRLPRRSDGAPPPAGHGLAPRPARLPRSRVPGQAGAGERSRAGLGRHPGLSRRSRAGKEDLYVIPARGGAERRLTDDPAHDILPRFTPDGRGVVFSSDRTGHFQIWEVPSDGGPARASAPTAPRSGRSDPSPDGRRIAFLSDVEGPVCLFILESRHGRDAAPGSPRQAERPRATRTGAPTAGASCSRRTGASVGTTSTSWTWPAARSSAASGLLAGGCEPRFSRDGRRVAYVDRAQIRRSRSRIVERELASGDERVLVDWPALNYDPVYSPDGSEIAFASTVTGEYAGLPPTAVGREVVAGDPRTRAAPASGLRAAAIAVPRGAGSRRSLGVCMTSLIADAGPPPRDRAQGALHTPRSLRATQRPPLGAVLSGLAAVPGLVGKRGSRRWLGCASRHLIADAGSPPRDEPRSSAHPLARYARPAPPPRGPLDRPPSADYQSFVARPARSAGERARRSQETPMRFDACSLPFSPCASRPAGRCGRDPGPVGRPAEGPQGAEHRPGRRWADASPRSRSIRRTRTRSTSPSPRAA